ncbi:MAG: cytochrome C biogenesis protein [Thermoproteus sp.]
MFEEQVLSSPSVASLLSGLNLYALNAYAHPLPGLQVKVEGQVVYVDIDAQTVKYVVANGTRYFPIEGTPAVLIGRVKNGTITLLGFWIGGVPPSNQRMDVQFSQFVKEALGISPSAKAQAAVLPSLFAALATSAVMGFLSAFSPCVLPVLSLAGVTYLARRSLWKMLAGLVTSFLLFSAILASLGSALVPLRQIVATIGGSILAALGLTQLVGRLNVEFSRLASYIQTAAFKRTRGAGDFLLGASLGAVWLPCVSPYAGVAIAATLYSLAGSPVDAFISIALYGACLAAAVYLIVRGLVKIGKKIGSMRHLEQIVGVIAIALGAYIIWTSL